MKSAKTATPAQPNYSAFPLLLAIVLIVLFCKSFLPDYVHFANDGPLGQQVAAYARMPAGFTGIWADQNDIGVNGGSATPDFSTMVGGILGPLYSAKFLAAITLFVLGIAAWTFFRQLKLSPLASTLGALATALNGSYFGNACWGTFPQQLAMSAVLFAMALVMANSDETPRLVRWTRLALAGLAVGVSVMEGADNGAIFSLFVAAYVFYKSIIEENRPALQKIGRGIGRVAIIAIFAAFISWQTVNALVNTYLVGAGGAGAGPGNSPESSQQHWDWATQWSLPKTETLGAFVPGLFGYRLDTPKDMMDFLQPHYQGGVYWGGVGRDPAIDRFFDSGAAGSPPQGLMRFGYAGYYCGILVALVALFTIAQSFRRENSLFPLLQRRFIWFWTAAMMIGLLLGWGRFGFFGGYPYRWFYELPHASSIRNPVKFTAIFYLGMIIIFAYGMDALNRRYMQPQAAGNKPASWLAQFESWWKNVRGFERNWSLFCVITFAISVLAWLVYGASKDGLVKYLQKVGYDEEMGKQIAAFSIGQSGWFLLLFATAIVLMILVLAGVFSGKRAKVGGYLIIALILVDMGRADLPWIIHWNYKQKYASNSIIDVLRDKPYEHRVTELPSDGLFHELYQIEWMQHQFPYYNVQCSDIIESPRMAGDLIAYKMALSPTPDTTYLVARRWQLSNTRFLLAPAGYLNSINDQLDPTQRRFHIVQRFNVVPKPGIERPTELEQMTAAPDDNGDFALFEYTGALPRAKLYSNWEVNTNDNATLKTLTAANFDPQKTVLVSNPLPAGTPMTSPTGENPGTVDFTSYAPKDIVFNAQAARPSVLLLNDRFDPNWRVLVDDKPAELLRCNFIMRGVFLTPGSHTVEFRFSLPHDPLYVTLTAWGTGILLGGLLFISTRRPPLAPKNNPAPAVQEAVTGRASAGNRKPSSERARPASQ